MCCLIGRSHWVIAVFSHKVLNVGFTLSLSFFFIGSSLLVLLLLLKKAPDASNWFELFHCNDEDDDELCNKANEWRQYTHTPTHKWMQHNGLAIPLEHKFLNFLHTLQPLVALQSLLSGDLIQQNLHNVHIVCIGLESFFAILTDAPTQWHARLRHRFGTFGTMISYFAIINGW